MLYFKIQRNVRDKEKPESDIDVLVEFDERKSLLTLVNIELELSDYLGVRLIC